MAIETICKGCAKKLRVADDYAGRKARCPHCKTVYTVPNLANAPDAASDVTVAPDDQWRVRNKDGSVYGPVAKGELDQWVNEGRVAAKSELQRDGTTRWVAATSVYPKLAGQGAASTNPFAEKSATSTSTTNPYSAPTSGGRLQGTYRYAAHRGGLILTFGILGILCCQIFSIVAWVMGHNDMQEINAGRMDPEGRGLTQAGMIIGIVGTVLLIIGVGFQGLFVVGAILSEM